MALIEYKCTQCGKTQYVFSGEESRRLDTECGCTFRARLQAGPKFCDLAARANPPKWRKMAPNPIVVHTTDTWMSEPHLDSFETTYELDRVLNLEAAAAKEMEIINDVRRKL